MPPAPCPPSVWAGRAAEEVLNLKERSHYVLEDPDYVPRPRRKRITGMQPPFTKPAGTAPLQSVAVQHLLPASPEARSPVACARSFSSASLKPLEPPALSSGSPFASSLGFLRREPSEFRLQRENLARSQALKLLRAVYRSCIEAMGLTFYNPPAWPPKTPKDPSVDLMPVRYLVSPLSQVAELPLHARAPPSKGSFIKKERSPASLPGSIQRQETIRKMKAFGRETLGGPYTVGQIYQEIEADICHRDAADVRALSGRLGSAALGPGTTRMRRKLPFAKPWLTFSGFGGPESWSASLGPLEPLEPLYRSSSSPALAVGG
ncbi:unnamed protein product [Polarella glacialis]|uniref:Uncharacterized protein n=1 Tax=Polarella glacialis TaxID=89957 RepID=A0A813IVB4_POLGL|nr:unnamed protein product [Polarella glacialis]CAE8657533.1 unnamed protein product [Polarella glacialis]